MSKTLSEILEQLHEPEFPKESLAILEHEIKSWVAEEIIGQDDSEFDAGLIIIHDKDMNPQEVFSPHKTRNQLRAEQRKRLQLDNLESE